MVPVQSPLRPWPAAHVPGSRLRHSALNIYVEFGTVLQNTFFFFVPSNSSRSVGRARESLVTPRCVGGVEGDDGCVPDPEARARIVQFNLSLRDRALRPK